MKNSNFPSSRASKGHLPDIWRFEDYPPKVMRLIWDRVVKVNDFASLRTRHLEDDLSTYHHSSKIITYPLDIESVWNLYTFRKPDETWTGPMVEFLFAYSERSGEFYYAGDTNMPVIHQGMQFYCCVNIFGPRLIVGLKLLNLDPVNHLLEIAYVEGGLYRGTQFLQFYPEENHTRIVHESYYKSDSLFRDLVLYPVFHRRTTGEFHRCLKKEIGLLMFSEVV